ncbi:MAG: hypothetical protein ACOX3U_00655 [Christensenellales bacterium]|jgi:hypothetical protein
MAREFKGFNGAGKDKVSKKNVEDVVSKYKGKSENELMSEILSRYAEGIKKGTISKEELDKFANNAKSYLTPEQMQKLRTILNKLKNT